jgi:hypothetical protein
VRLVWGGVCEVLERREGLERLSVELDDGASGVAVCYTGLTGECSAGDRVLVNATAVDLRLGTGGFHVVVARLSGAAGAVGVSVDDPSGGHVMKLRYTPVQRDVMAAESPESPHHASLADAIDTFGMPVVCCALHSHVPLVAAGLKESVPGARVAFVMTDGAALPLALSELAAACAEAGLVDETVTCGQAFGGSYEAVNLYSGLLVARIAARADVAVVAMGPGVVGTGTAFGHGGVAQGEAINAAASVGGSPVAALRVSFADTRPRHRGVSHHSITALTRVALAGCRVAVPEMDDESTSVIDRALAEAGVWARHERVTAIGDPLPDTRGVALGSMGRTPADDPVFFAAAAAAGRAAGALLGETS